MRILLIALALVCAGCVGTKYRPYADIELVNHRNGARSYAGAGVSIIRRDGLITEIGPVLTFRPEDVGDGGSTVQDRSAGVKVSMHWVR